MQLAMSPSQLFPFLTGEARGSQLLTTVSQSPCPSVLSEVPLAQEISFNFRMYPQKKKTKKPDKQKNK